MFRIIECLSQGGTQHTHRDSIFLNHEELRVMRIDLGCCCQLHSLESWLEYRITSLYPRSNKHRNLACLRLFSSWWKITRRKPRPEDSASCMLELAARTHQKLLGSLSNMQRLETVSVNSTTSRVTPQLLTVSKFEKDSNWWLKRPVFKWKSWSPRLFP